MNFSWYIEYYFITTFGYRLTFFEILVIREYDCWVVLIWTWHSLSISKVILKKCHYIVIQYCNYYNPFAFGCMWSIQGVVLPVGEATDIYVIVLEFSRLMVDIFVHLKDLFLIFFSILLQKQQLMTRLFTLESFTYLR